jgi:hypothetical protein
VRCDPGGIDVECLALSPSRRAGEAGGRLPIAGRFFAGLVVVLLAVAPRDAWATKAQEPETARDPPPPAKAGTAEKPAEQVPEKPEEPAPAAPPTAAATLPAVEFLLPRSLGSTFDRQFLLDLPGQGLWSLFETVESTAILDRIDGAGLYVGEAGLLGIRGSSWTQASWTMGDLDITDPDRTGTPLFFADPDEIDTVDITAGLSPADHRGIGPGISLNLRRPGEAWHRSLELNKAPSALQQGRGESIARLESSGGARFQVDGPLIKDRLGLFLSGSLARGSRLERTDPRTLSGSENGLLAHLVYTPTPSDELRFVSGLQGVSHPYEGRARYGGGDVRQSDRFFQVQSTWQRRGPRPWSLTAGLVRGSFDPQVSGAPTGVIERTVDGPVQLQFPGTGSRGRLAMSGIFDPLTKTHHALRLGGALSLTRSTTRPAGLPGLTAEAVDGIPARVWDYEWAGPASRWRGSDLSLYATDQVRFGRLSVDGGVRFESQRGSAEGSASRIRWSDLSSRFVARFRPFGGRGLTLLSGYAWYHGRLPLSLLAYGDPAAPQGQVYRWRDDNGDGLFQPEEKGELVSRMGPGGARASIDPDLQSPRSRDVFVGFESRAGRWQFRFLAYHHRERNLITSVNVGAPASAYNVYFVPDPGNDINGHTDDQMLPIYDRRPGSLGKDRYLLTNDPEKGHDKGLEILIERSLGKRFRLLLGGTASKSMGPAAYRGFRASENDQGVVGERDELPNANTLSKGRLFFERGYNLKVAGTYEAPHDLRLGVVTRYQDGQHFARFVVATDLNQGPELIRAITNGQSRFTFVLTVDARMEKGFALGSRRLAAVLEGFNLGGSSIEVEENVISGPLYRAPSAVQPPRTVRLGLRLDF